MPPRPPHPAAAPAPTARVRVLRRRLYAIAASWLFIVVFFVMPVTFGTWIFVVPAVAFGAAAVATTLQARSPTGPDAETLAPGALEAATRRDPVEVHGTWTSGSAAGGRAAQKGLLRVADRRISFTTDAGDVAFDAPVGKVRLAAVPGFWRPQLDLDVGGATHTIRFFALWDLGATIVGPVVAGEWCDQLRALGAR